MKLEGRIYYRGEIIDACVEIEDGKIKTVKKHIPGCRKLRGLILPGAVDLHVHFREPGYTHKEDFYSGTMSAAYGGVTFVMDMPNTRPPVIDRETFLEKLSTVRTRANVDFSLYFMLSSKAERLKNINGAFKLYMGETTNAHAGEIIPTDAFISVHAELDECIRKTSKDLVDHDYARPEHCEVRAIKSLFDKGRFHIAHVSSNDSVDMCKIGKFTCEVTPHHIFLHRDMPLKAFGKVNPPLRAKWMTEKLWELLIDGSIDIVASDHAPHTYEEKDDDFESAPSGIPEVETYVPIFLYMVKRGRISLQRAVEILMSRPAELVGVKKGKIEPGYDADMIAVDTSNITKIRDRDLHYKCGWSPYEGFSAIFPHTTIVGGEIVIEDREFVGERAGKFVKINPF